jgi:hypothetical protein
MQTARSIFLSQINGAADRPRAEFAGIVSDAAAVLTSNHPRPVWRAIMREVLAPDYSAVDVLSAMFAPAIEWILEGGEYRAAEVSNGLPFVERAKIEKYGRILPISRELAINDRSLGFLADMTGSLIASAYRHEGDAVFGALTANANLADGSAWFGASNSVSAASVPTAIADGISALRSQAYPDGQTGYLEPFAIVLPAAWSLAAADIPAEFLAKPPLIIHSAAVSDAYVIADPAFNPTVALLTMSPGAIPEVSSSTNAGHSFLVDAYATMKIRHDYAVVPLSRTGIIRASVTEA